MESQNLLNFEGKVCVVTGAAVGIGEAIARRFHGAGARVILLDIHEDSVHKLSSELNYLRENSAQSYQLDVANYSEVKQVFDRIFDDNQKIDVLINNAGIFPVMTVSAMEEEDFQRVIDVNLKGVFNCLKFVAQGMVERNTRGNIINITSIDALKPSMVGLAHYDASKHGVWGFTKNAAREYSEYGIRINAIAPGGVATPGVAALQPTGEVDEQALKMQEAFISRLPLKRMGEPDEIAKVTLFLASDMASYMTGSQIVVDGGALLI